jgi:Reverse transcriptase (RNA-dependent DNA polymerase)
LNGNSNDNSNDEHEAEWHDAEETNWDHEEETKWEEWNPSKEEPWKCAEEANWDHNTDEKSDENDHFTDATQGNWNKDFDDATEGNWWKECRQWQLPSEATPKATTTKRDRTKPDPIGFPCALMLLGMIMWSMECVGMMLKTMNLTWNNYHNKYFEMITNNWPDLKRYLWPNEIPKPNKTQEMGKKRLLLLALLIAIKKAGSIPTIDVRGQQSAFKILQKRRGKNGLLMTGKLKESELATVREAILALPGTLIHKGDVKPVIVDTGCTTSASGDHTDFIPDSLMEIKEAIALEGIGGSLQVTHKGTMRYEVVLDNGDVEVITTPGMYMPDLNIRLFSPQAHAAHLNEVEGNKTWQYTLNWAGSKFHFAPGKDLSISNDPTLKLPTLQCFNNAVETAEALALTCVTDERNQNLTNLQKTLLQWHFKLGHVGFQNLQWIGRMGWLGPRGEKMGATSVEAPICGSCQYGKQERTPKGGSTITKDQERDGITKADKLEPGDLIFSDQYESRVPGKVFGKRGAAISSNSYCGGTIFVDAASGRIFNRHQVSLNAHETVETKHLFERDAASAGVIVQAYNTDNGVYTSKEFLHELAEKGQGHRRSGVGGHHHNGVAENAIKNVIRSARTLMIHAALRWPTMTERELWPLAVDHAVWLHNNTPKPDTRFSPEELWCKSKSQHSDLQRMHVWGCPTYVLDPRSQDGKKIPKWDPRARRGQFVGISPLHASHVGLIRNLRTNNISPQFHVVYDDFFATVHADEAEAPPEWEELLTFNRSRSEYDDEDYVPDLTDEWVDEQTRADRELRRIGRKKEQEERSARQKEQSARQKEHKPEERQRQEPPERNPSQSADLPHPDERANDPPPPHPGPEWVETREERDDGLRRGTRHRKPVTRFGANFAGSTSQHARILCKATFRQLWTNVIATRAGNSDNRYLYALLMDPEFGIMENIFPHAISQVPSMLKATKSDPDCPTLQEALAGPQREEFLEAMAKEIEELEQHGTWTVTQKSAVPEGANILPSTWVLRIKRYPDGRFRKVKARFCARGDRQIEGVDYFEKYAPVVSWTTVRLLLCMSITQGWKTRQVDFSNAFVQATLDKAVYIKLPAGFEGNSGEQASETVLSLNKSLYGLVDAPMYWYNHLVTKMDMVGLKPSPLDPCMFYGRGMIMLSYVDDCLFFGPDQKEIDQVIQDIKGLGMSLTVENDTAYAFLGVDVEEIEGGGYKMSQKGLTKKIIKVLGMEECNTKSTPAGTGPIGTDASGEAFDEKWSYPQAVGMLLYLSSNSRPDIQFAVHQCARFTHFPKKSHGEAVKRICRYLQGTMEQGLEFKPTAAMELDMYVDADFAGLWNHEDDQDPVCVKSRTGYVITLGSCPVTWVSKLQTEIALSTLESEYIALSQGMRDLLPMRRLLMEIGTTMNLDFAKPALVHSTIFEDNNGALGLATAPKLTPRTKHIGVKYHWFKSHIGEEQGILIKKVDTHLQKADMFTKGLPYDTLRTIRKLVMGW